MRTLILPLKMKYTAQALTPLSSKNGVKTYVSVCMPDQVFGMYSHTVTGYTRLLADVMLHCLLDTHCVPDAVKGSSGKLVSSCELLDGKNTSN